MRKIVLTLMSTLAAVFALFGYRTSTPHPAVATPTAASAGSGGSSTGRTTTTTPTAPTPSAGATTAAARTVTGDAAQTRWGPVQVAITVTGGKITGVDLVQVPAGNGRDVEINDHAVPVLTQETLSAQSADIDAVSGATVTSDGYITSLQSALDQAGL